MDLETYLKEVNKTHLIFDFDETLVKLMLPWDHWEDEIKVKLLELDPSIYSDYKKSKITLSDLINQYTLKFGKLAKKLLTENALHFETSNLKEVIPNGKLLEFIKNSEGYTMFLWSSNTRPIIEKVLEQHQIRNKFEKLITNTDVEFIKPYAEGFYKIYNPTISKGHYLLVGDSDLDKKAARDADIDFFKISFFK